MQSSFHIVRVFNKPEEALGNHAAVFLDDKTFLADNKSRVSADIHKNQDVNTTCFISHIEKSCYEVQCFNGENNIQCCGHGMIAAAKTVFSVTDKSAIIMNENVTASRVIDEHGTEQVELKLPRLTSHKQYVPDWIEDVIFLDREKLSPDLSAISEDEDGYLLLEFNPAIPLDKFRSIYLESKIVCEKTNRAIVIIQLDKKSKHLYLRYFAPQYGVVEDIATGSVMRFVADYIEQNYQINHFDVSQCSTDGGFMKIDCSTETVKITANASIETVQ